MAEKPEYEEMLEYIQTRGWVREMTTKPPYKDAKGEIWPTGWWINPRDTEGHRYGIENAFFIELVHNNEHPLLNEIDRMLEDDDQEQEVSDPVLGDLDDSVPDSSVDSGGVVDETTPEQYKERSGKSFRMKKDQVNRGLNRMEAFEEFKGTFQYRKAMGMI